jgi:hypothetical protein
VHTVDDFYDGPRSGVADFGGAPHHYRAVDRFADGWCPDDDRFELSPVSPEIMSAAKEFAGIFERWESVARSTIGFTHTEEGFGALQPDRERSRALEALLSTGFGEARRNGRLLVRGEFAISASEDPSLRVRWTLIDPDCLAQPGGPANGGQPLSPDSLSTPPAAGPRR